jgi:hypothetical protein
VSKAVKAFATPAPFPASLRHQLVHLSELPRATVSRSGPYRGRRQIDEFTKKKPGNGNVSGLFCDDGDRGFGL